MKPKQWRGAVSYFSAGSFLMLGAGACAEPEQTRASARDEVLAQAGASDGIDASVLEPFSFFITSLRAMQELSGSAQGFGGDLRFGETGENAGLRGADKICTTIAEQTMPGSGAKVWRAFLSTTKGGPNGGPVHAIDRIGEGPWYDRVGRVFSLKKADLLSFRPASADPQIKNDFPNEDGVPNHNPDGTGEVDNHDFLTGSGTDGKLYKNDPRVTCNDWTKSEPDPADAPRVGHAWPRSFGPGGAMGDGGLPNFGDFFRDGGFVIPPGLFGDAGNPFAGGFPFPFPGFGGRDGGGFPAFGDGGSPFPFPFPGGGGFPAFGDGGSPFPFPFPGGGPAGGNPFGAAGQLNYGHWASSLDEAGCGAGVSIIEMGPPWESNPTVGSGGGYGGIYCFALTP